MVRASGECEVSPTSRPCSCERCKQTSFPSSLMTLRPWGVCWCQGTHCRSAIRQGSINREEVLLIQFGSSYGVLLRLQISVKSLQRKCGTCTQWKFNPVQGQLPFPSNIYHSTKKTLLQYEGFTVPGRASQEYYCVLEVIQFSI